MTVEETITDAFERALTEFQEDARFGLLLSGSMNRDAMVGFSRRFIVTHLNSVQLLAFLYSVSPRNIAALVRENLLEEMGLEQEGGVAHPDLLVTLARGLGCSDADIAALHTAADQLHQSFVAQPLDYHSLRTLGLSLLLETVAFETLLSRISDPIAHALVNYYGLSTAAVEWFTLHGEVDIKHAEEGREVLRGYIASYAFTETEVTDIVRRTFADNVFLHYYFPDSTTDD